jgi:hypothetical protein
VAPIVVTQEAQHRTPITGRPGAFNIPSSLGAGVAGGIGQEDPVRLVYDEPVAFRRTHRESRTGSVEYGPFPVRGALPYDVGAGHAAVVYAIMSVELPRVLPLAAKGRVRG